MSNAPIKSNWARFAFIVLALLWATTGWFVLRYGGFYTSHKYSQITTFVDGLGAIFMAYLFFFAGNGCAGGGAAKFRGAAQCLCCIGFIDVGAALRLFNP